MTLKGNRMAHHTETRGVASPPSIERIPEAARRMGVSISQVYREIKAGRLGPLVKLGPRASGLPSSSIDKWIIDKIEASPGFLAAVEGFKKWASGNQEGGAA